MEKTGAGGKPQAYNIENGQYIGKINAEVYKIIKKVYKAQNDDVIITNKWFGDHIDGNHNDYYKKHKDELYGIISDPDYVFKDKNHENGLIFVGKVNKTQIIISINSKNRNWKNTIISLYGCGDTTLKKLLKHRELLYKKTPTQS